MASLFVNLLILCMTLVVSFVGADVSHLRGYNRFDRPSSTRLQRLESYPAPYAASGYRPNREFSLPREQPIFPLGNQVPQDNDQSFNTDNEDQNQIQNQNQNNNNFVSDNQSEPQQPQLTYGAPSRLRQAAAVRFQQQQEQQYYTSSQRLAQPKPARLSSRLQQQQQFQSPTLQTKYSTQPKPARLTAALQQPQGFYSGPQLFLNNPQPNQRFIQPKAARLTAALQQPQQPQQPQQAQQQFFIQQSPQQAELFVQPKPARLTDNREDAEDEEDTRTNAANDDAEDAADIETASKKQEEPKKTETPQTMATVAYYPAGAFSFVQPISANYVAAPGAYPAQYIAAGNPYAQQPLTLSAAPVPAQLQAAW